MCWSDLEFPYDVFYKVGGEGVINERGKIIVCEGLSLCMWGVFGDESR